MKFSSIKQAVRDNPRGFHLFIAVVLIIVFYHFRYGLSIFNPTYINWVIDDVELANGFFSFGYYRYESLHWPIGKIDAYFYPLGTNLFTSDIPLLALFFKPFSAVLPDPFQYIGLWYLLCHVLQAWFAILLCERFGIKGITRVIVVAFFSFAPVLMARFIHPVLFCQWMVLAGLWIYFLDPKIVSVNKILRYQFILFIVAGLEFAYMWAMVFGFSVALLLRLWLIDKKLSFGKTIGFFSFAMFVMASMWFAIGLFSFDGIPDYEMEGWGAFTLNLNSMYNPMGRGALLPTQPYAWPQHHEGYAYLGAGLLLLLLICFGIVIVNLIRKKGARSGLFTFSGVNVFFLYLFLAFSFVYALSNRISFNNEVILQYPINHSFSSLLNAFRSGGRFFWSVYYFLFIAMFCLIDRTIRNSILRNTLLGCCLIIQFYDLKPFLEKYPITYEPYNPPINAVWEKMISGFDQVLFYPGFKRSYLSLDDYRYFAYYTTSQHKPINAGYSSRFNIREAEKEIGKMGMEVATKGLNERALYIAIATDLNSLILPISRGRAYCFSIDGYLAIFAKTPSNESLAKHLEEKGFTDESRALAVRFMLRPWDLPDSLRAAEGVRSGIYIHDQSDNHFYLKGWTFSEQASPSDEDSVFLVLESVEKKYWIGVAHRFGTPDVADFFGKPALAMAGYSFSMSNSNLKSGPYRAALLYKNNITGVVNFFWQSEMITIDKASVPFLASLPVSASGEVRFDVNRIEYKENTVVIEAWAFPKDARCERCKTYFTLTSGKTTYWYEVAASKREDVADFFKDPTLLNTGRNMWLHSDSLPSNAYNLGIVIMDTISMVTYFSSTDKIVAIGDNTFATVSPLNAAPTGQDSIRAFIDRVEDKGDFIEFAGWSFINGVSTDFSTASIVLRSATGMYMLTAKDVERPDLRTYFKLPYNTDHAGFLVRIKKESIPPGEYKVCVIMKNLKTDQRSMSCLEAVVKF